LFVFIGRLTEQKGVKVLLEVLPALLRGEACFIALASGEEMYEERLRQLAKRFRKRMKFVQRFDEPLAHKLEAAGDMLLMPSLYEPCGLNQIYSLRYGTVPIVRATGGLADTVSPFVAETKQGTGFLFNENSAEALLAEIHRALALFPDRELWQALQKNGMRENFSWDDSAAHYLNLFQNLLAKEKSDG
jgi:starch synthase